MVSIRRRRLLGLCSGIEDVTSSEATKSVSVHLVSSNANGYKPKEETTLENGSGSSNSNASANSSPSKEDHAIIHQYPAFKRRKRHRRKHVENQEPCVMRGVYFKNMKWQAAIKVDKKQIHLGTVGSQEEAARLYDRAAFKCGREPNFELSEEEKKKLSKVSWDEFLAMTRSTITNKKNSRRRSRSSPQKKLQDNDSEPNNGSSGSDEDPLIT